LAFQVKTQAQAVQMLKRLQRNLARRALRGFGKHQFAQLRESRRRQTQYAGTNSKDTGTTMTAIGSLGLNDMASINSFSNNGTPTLASLAPTMKDKAANTRHLYCHR